MIVKKIKDSWGIFAEKGDCVSTMYEKAHGGELVAAGFASEQDAQNQAEFFRENTDYLFRKNRNVQFTRKILSELELIAALQQRSVNWIIKHAVIDFLIRSSNHSSMPE